MRDLGSLGGALPNTTVGAINVSGQVVGSGTSLDGSISHAFITGPHGIGMRDLGTLGGEFVQSGASGINSAGIVVGSSSTAGPLQTQVSHAFITGANGQGMFDLNRLVDMPAGVYLTDATAINDNGQIAAMGSDFHVYLVSGVPEPSAAILLTAAAGVLWLRWRHARGAAPDRCSGMRESVTRRSRP